MGGLSQIKGLLLLLILFCLVGFGIDDTVGQHSFCLQMQGLNSNGDPLQLPLDVDEVIDLVVIDFFVCGNFDQSVLFLADRVQGCKHLQNDGRELFDLYLRHVLLADGTLGETVVVAERGTLVLFRMVSTSSG